MMTKTFMMAVLGGLLVGLGGCADQVVPESGEVASVTEAVGGGSEVETTYFSTPSYTTEVGAIIDPCSGPVQHSGHTSGNYIRVTTSCDPDNDTVKIKCVANYHVVPCE